MRNIEQQGACRLCGRFATTLSEHHLIPRTVHSNKRACKMFTDEEMNHTELFCQPCHRACHIFWDEKELAFQFNTVEVLRGDERIQKHMAWIRKQRDSYRMSGHRKGQKEREW